VGWDSSRYSDSLWAGWYRDQILVGARFFYTHPDWPWGPPRPLYNRYHVTFQGVKRPGHGVDHPPPSGVEVKNIV